MANTISGNKNTTLRTTIKGNGKPLLLLHGMGGTAPLCRLMEELSSKYIVIQPVMPGFLPEDGVINYTDSMYVDFLEQLRSELKIDKWSVVGYSMGGRTALNYSISSNTHVDKLVIIDGAGSDYLFSLTKSKIGKIILSHSIYYSMFFSGLRNKTIATDFLDLQSSWFHIVKQMLSAMMKSRTIRRNFANIFVEISAPIPELEQKLKCFNNETLILWALQDQTIPPSHGRHLKKLIANSEIKLLDQYKHLAVIEHPDFFVQNIFCFL